jgi:hypothetical protein
LWHERTHADPGARIFRELVHAALFKKKAATTLRAAAARL